MTRSAAPGRLVLLVLLLCATVWSQSVALAAEEHHHTSSEHCCLLCHIGPIPVLHSSVTSLGIPRIGFAYLIGTENTCSVRGGVVPDTSSRAPPA